MPPGAGPWRPTLGLGRPSEAVAGESHPATQSWRARVVTEKVPIQIVARFEPNRVTWRTASSGRPACLGRPEREFEIAARGPESAGARTLHRLQRLLHAPPGLRLVLIFPTVRIGRRAGPLRRWRDRHARPLSPRAYSLIRVSSMGDLLWLPLRRHSVQEFPPRRECSQRENKKWRRECVAAAAPIRSAWRPRGVELMSERYSCYLTIAKPPDRFPLSFPTAAEIRRRRGCLRRCDWGKARRANLELKRINVDFPAWVVEALDREARRLGGTREALVKLWIAERLERAAIAETAPWLASGRIFARPPYPASANSCASASSTDTSWLTPFSAMVTPNRRSMRDIVTGLWVIVTKRVSARLRMASSRSQKRSTL